MPVARGAALLGVSRQAAAEEAAANGFKERRRGDVIKNIRLMSLRLSNFQGGSLMLHTKGGNVSIYGDNGTGKTRVFSAFQWLLFGKDSLGRADFEIKNLDALGRAESGLEHEVEAVLSVDGVHISLKKVYREIWTKTRGRAARTFTGNTTDYFIDGVPSQKKEYTARVAEVSGDEEVFRLLTSPTVFSTLHWTKQRAILLEVCGDLSDSQVMESSDKLSGLAEILGTRKLDDHKKVIAARRGEINKELEKIPVRIDEVRRGQPDITGLILQEIKKEIADLETALDSKKQELLGIDTGGTIAGLSKKLSGINADLLKIEDARRAEEAKLVAGLDAEIADLSANCSNGYRRTIDLSAAVGRNKKRSAMILADLTPVRGGWITANAQEFQDSLEDTCPSCGQSLPTELVQAAREKAQAAFSLEKAIKLKGLNDRGMYLKVELDGLREELAALEAERVTVREALEADETELARINKARNIVRDKVQESFGTSDYAALKKQWEKVSAAIENEKAGHVREAGQIKQELAEMEGQLKGAKEGMNKFSLREAGEKRIVELLAGEKRLAGEIERLEKELYLCEEFLRTKVTLLTERINSRFELVSFKLFAQQVNGALSECCEMTVNGIPSSGGLNAAAKLNGGLDCCRTFSKHYGLQAPVFIDNAESVVKLLNMDCQVIRLVVSEPDKKLRVEV